MCNAEATEAAGGTREEEKQECEAQGQEHIVGASLHSLIYYPMPDSISEKLADMISIGLQTITGFDHLSSRKISQPLLQPYYQMNGNALSSRKTVNERRLAMN
jgi:hypothetical protein